MDLNPLDNLTACLNYRIEIEKKFIEKLEKLRDMLPLIREDAMEEFIEIFGNELNFNNMFQLVERMITVYDNTKSIEESDKEGAKITDNSDHGIAKKYVVYFYKDGADFLSDWNSQCGNESGDKGFAYDQFINSYEASRTKKR